MRCVPKVKMDFIQYRGVNYTEVELFCGYDFFIEGNDCIVATVNGYHTLRNGQYIIKGKAGLFVVSAETFANDYYVIPSVKECKSC